MKNSKVTILWNDGLHARTAARLVQLAPRFRSTINIRCGEQMANARSFLSVLLLCATVGTTMDIEVWGDDEEQGDRSDGERIQFKILRSFIPERGFKPIPELRLARMGRR